MLHTYYVRVWVNMRVYVCLYAFVVEQDLLASLYSKATPPLGSGATQRPVRLETGGAERSHSLFWELKTNLSYPDALPSTLPEQQVTRLGPSMPDNTEY